MFTANQPIKSKQFGGKYEFVEYIPRKRTVSPHTGNVTIQDCIVRCARTGFTYLMHSADFVARKTK